MFSLANLAAPVLYPTSAGVLRPRFGHFPVALLLLCMLWLWLLRRGLPGFGRRATIAGLGGAALLLVSWLPRIAARTWGLPLLTPSYYYLVILPATAVQMTLLLSLLTAPLWLILGVLGRRRAHTETPAAQAPAPALSRRDALAALAWAGPGVALVLGGYGVAEAQRLVVRRLRLQVPGLPPGLRGLRIGQLTDSHVAADLTPLGKFERGCELLAGERLDLLCATGDLCDSPALLRDVLRLLAQVPARLGRFACLGNHETYLGLPFVRRSYGRSQVHLLEEESVPVGSGSGSLRVAGVSYPHGGGGPRIDLERVPRLFDEALRGRGGEATTLMLAHHPHMFKQAAGHGIDLMLSGHTHGGQVGLREGSLLEPAYGYVRGVFRAPDGGTQLFVSAGLGHWLPWRVNCPPEVVVIELI